MSRFSSVIFYLCFVITGMGCTRLGLDPSATVHIHLPAQNISTANKIITQTAGVNDGSQWGLEAPSSVFAFDCYALYVQASDFGTGSCLDKSGNEVAAVSRILGLYKQGSEISVELASGSQRTLGILGLKSADGTCAGAFSADFAAAKYSAPILVGKVTADLTPGIANLTLPIKMSSQAIERCQGEAFSKWPKCNLTLAQAAYVGDGQLNLNGSCLEQTTSVKIENITDGTTTNLDVVSKTATNVVAKLTSQLAMSKNKYFRVLIATADAQNISIGLSVVNDFTVTASGTYVGTWLAGFISNGNVGSGTPLFVENSASEILGYAYQTTQKFIGGWFAIEPHLVNLSLSDIRQMSMLAPRYDLYFTGANCTGDVVFNPGGIAGSTIKAAYVVAPQSCSGSANAITCPTTNIFKITSAPTYEASIAVASKSGYNAMNYNGDPTICEAYSNTASGYRVPSANLQSVTLGSGGAPPATLSNVVFGRK